jgi:hypothetical protein
MSTPRPVLRRRKAASVIAAALLAVCSVAVTSTPDTPAQSHDRPPLVKPGPFARAGECAGCHQVIHDGWSESAHARAATTPGFTTAIAGLRDAPEALEGCAACHAPTVRATHDLGLEMPITREGVTCDFCHTVAEMRPGSGGAAFVLDPGPLKRGPFLYTESPWHGTGFSPLFKSGPLLCAGCHEHVNVQGVAVLTTWSEWKESDWPGQGVSCQDCHMPLAPGATAERATGGQSRRLVNGHRIVGGTSRSWVHHGIDLSIDTLRLDGATLEAVVSVNNAGAGHRVPGGLPGRRLVLEVGFETAAVAFRPVEERTWQRVLLDAQGQPLDDAGAIFLRAAREGTDTRLRPGEVRSERFRLVPPPGSRALVARLEYRDASNPSIPQRIALITEVRRNLPPP